MITKIQKNRVEKLIAVLRSGKYQQARRALRVIKEEQTGYCCLGVACDVMRLSRRRGDMKWEGQRMLFTKKPEAADGVLSKSVRDYFGFTAADGFDSATGNTDVPVRSLAGHNDNGETFEQIAVRIEKWLSEQKVKS